jgi:hypothetical protein
VTVRLKQKWLGRVADRAEEPERAACLAEPVAARELVDQVRALRGVDIQRREERDRVDLIDDAVEVARARAQPAPRVDVHRPLHASPHDADTVQDRLAGCARVLGREARDLVAGRRQTHEDRVGEDLRAAALRVVDVSPVEHQQVHGHGRL